MAWFVLNGISQLRDYFRGRPERPSNRHVHFSPSTLSREAEREALAKATTSAFRNFLNEVHEAQQQFCSDGQPLDVELARQLAIRIWCCMDGEQRLKYVQLALAAQDRRRRHLPLEPPKRGSMLQMMPSSRRRKHR